MYKTECNFIYILVSNMSLPLPSERPTSPHLRLQKSTFYLCIVVLTILFLSSAGIIGYIIVLAVWFCRCTADAFDENENRELFISALA